MLKTEAVAATRRFSHLNWVLLDQALVSGSNFLVGLLLVRYLGLEQYGQYVLLWMGVQFVMSIQNALVLSPMLSIAPKMPSAERRAYYSATLVWQLTLAVCLTGVAVLIALLPSGLRPGWLNAEVMLPLLGCVLVVQLQDFLRRYLFSTDASRRAFFIDLFAYGAQLPLIALVLSSEPSLAGALTVVLVTMLVSAALGWRWLEVVIPGRRVLRDTLLRHWRSSKWLLGDAVLHWVSGNYFLVVAGALLGPVMVGAIRAAQNLLGLTHILFQGLENLVPAEASRRLHRNGSAALMRYVGKTMLILLAVTGTIALVAATFAEPILRLAYGAADPASVTALLWYVPFYILVAIALPLRAGLRSFEKTRSLFIAQLLCALFSVLTAHYLITRFGLHGVMGGMLAGLSLTSVILAIALGKNARRC
ncbi:MATE family efflux transporter [Pseudomonas sp.]|uniref:MATE family efflux transporter n=1 Tax=Pseudomonas sp. TaxID=306 RepID=UPI00272A7034|nr:MATE family efflux transporter [Pseudomonas sp.]